MKDIIITAKKIRREAALVLLVFVVAELINLYAIAKFDTKWSELYSQMGYVLIVAMILYMLMLIVRLFIQLIRSVRK